MKRGILLHSDGPTHSLYSSGFSCGSSLVDKLNTVSFLPYSSYQPYHTVISLQALAREPPPNMQYYLPHDETLNGSINRTCEDSQIEKDE